MRAYAPRLRGRALLPALLAGALAATPAAARQVGAAAAYKALTGDDLPAGDPPPVAVGAFPGGPAGVLVAATMDASDDAGGEIGPLTVGLLTRSGAGLSIVASSEGVDQPALERAITPSTPGLAIDPATFRISPHEVAVAVDLTETLITTSTSVEASTLHLYRRVGRRLVPIFSAQTEDETLDKTAAAGRERNVRFIVRFTPHTTRGFYDLVLQRRGARAGRTYAWTGARYAPARRP